MNSYIFNIFLAVTILCAVVPAYGGGYECDTVCYGGPFDICRKCASYCPLTCDNYNETIACPAVCVIDTCECSLGTVRNVETGQCILSMQCPKVEAY